MRVLLPCCLVLAAACDAPSTTKVDFRRAKPQGLPAGTWVARFAGDTLSDEELKQRFAEMNPYARARFQTVEQRKEYVEGLARFELLAQEAVRRGLASDPEVVETAKRVMVQLLLKKELEEGAGAVSDEQVRAYYEAHRGDYVKPAMTRLAHISFKKGNRAKAEAVLRQALALAPLDYAAFGKLARDHSEEPRTQPLEGDLRFLSDGELAAQYGQELVPAAAGLTQVGQVHPTLVETDSALHVLKLQGRQVALNLSVEQAKPSIASVLMNESKQERFRALLERLKKQGGYELNEAALAAIVVDPKAPAVEPKGPQPGYLPAPNPPPPTR